MHTTGNITKKIRSGAILLALMFAFGTTAHATVTASPTTINFGNQKVGTTSPPTFVTLTSTGGWSTWGAWGTRIVSASLSADEFSYSGPSLPVFVDDGDSVTFSVRFAPTNAQAFAGTLVFKRSNGSTIAVALRGTGVKAPPPAQPPAITSQPASRTVTAGQTASFSVGVTGTAPLTYQWSKNGGTISGAGSSSYTTPATTASDNGAQLTVVVTNSAGNATSTAAVLTVNAAAVAPAITSQPSSRTVTAGQVATFTVSANGTAPIIYQWQKNGAPISGATSSTYTTPPTTASDNAAQFTVAASNPAGSATSTAAILTVNAAAVAPAITMQPSSQTVITGQTATFAVAATGTAPMAYQWKKNGTAIGGATSSTYTTPATTAWENGSQFTVVISNGAGSATSNAALLSVSGAASCVQSSSTAWTNTAFSTQTAPFTVTYDATPSQASMDAVMGFSLGAATDYTSLAAITRFSSANGKIDVRNGANYAADTIVPFAASLTYHFRVVIDPNAHQYSVYVTPPGSLEITVATNYAFRAEQAALSSFNNWATYSEIGSVTVCNVVFGPAPAPTPVAPTITAQPASQTVVSGQAATFRVAATGTAPMTYQWKKNGTAISGATSSTYTTPTTTSSDNTAQFNVAVANSAGNATSATATLTVNAATLALNASSTALSFGNVIVSASSTQNVTLTNAGNSNITISNVSVSGPGFNATGVSTGLILTPGQTATLKATFTPAATGSVTGSASVMSNASNSPDTIALSGTGLAQVKHSVSLSWSPSTSTVIGYNSYSSTVSGGPYVKLNTAPVPTTTYTDTTVQSGLTYYYVVTAVDSTNAESTFSTEVPANIP
jgi:beta-galactosidase